MKILLTGFEAFGNLQANPSQQIVERMAERARRQGIRDLYPEILPTEYAGAGRRIRQLIQRVRPEAALCLGVARSRTVIHLERVALNLDDDPLPDNAGRAYSGRPIVRGGPLVYESTLPLQRMLNALRRQGIPATISNHAGTFVCNHVFYVARHALEQMGREIPCGLIHVPEILRKSRRSRRTDRGMPLQKMVEAIECCLRVVKKRL
ncbi:MAG: hypothetical protein HY647_05335 [Acidobacteria bacterium]|nr:hypothetical protein [Acidobacteriota bacterium]